MVYFNSACVCVCAHINIFINNLQRVTFYAHPILTFKFNKQVTSKFCKTMLVLVHIWKS